MKTRRNNCFANLQNVNSIGFFNPLKQKFLTVLLGVSGVFFSSNLSAQGETCGDPIEISASYTYSETSLQFADGQDKVFVSFYSS